MMNLRFEIDEKTREDAIEAMAHRKSSGEYAEAKIGPGAFLVWDSCSSPYILVEQDSPFGVGEPDERCYWLCDYGPLGDDLEYSVVHILQEVLDDVLPEFEIDRGNSTDTMLCFHGHLRRRT